MVGMVTTEQNALERRCGAKQHFQNADVSKYCSHLKIKPKKSFFTDYLCSGARCITPPPVPPPEANLESPVFEESEGLVGFRTFSCSVPSKVFYTRISNKATYKCQAGGFNMRLDKDPGDDWSKKFGVECRNGNVPTWEEPNWPTCASSEFWLQK